MLRRVERHIITKTDKNHEAIKEIKSMSLITLQQPCLCQKN